MPTGEACDAARCSAVRRGAVRLVTAGKHLLSLDREGRLGGGGCATDSPLGKLRLQRRVAAAATQRVSRARHCCVTVPVINRDQLVVGDAAATAAALALAC